LGRPLVSFVSGLEMQELTRMLLARVRRGPTLALEFRCDSPCERRHLRMDLSVLTSDGVLCSTTLLRAEPRAARPLIDTGTARTDEVLTICSWCRRIRLPGVRWVEVDHAIEALGLFQETALPQLSHGICVACRDRLRGDD
jgi:hypothetical protein